MNLLKKIEGISIVHFNKNDIVRHRLVREIVEAYETYYEEQEQRNAEQPLSNRRGFGKRRNTEGNTETGTDK